MPARALCQRFLRGSLTPFHQYRQNALLDAIRDNRKDPPAVWFTFSPDWQGKHPQQHLRQYCGALQTDAYGGYDRLFSTEREGGRDMWQTGSRTAVYSPFSSSSANCS